MPWESTLLLVLSRGIYITSPDSFKAWFPYFSRPVTMPEIYSLSIMLNRSSGGERQPP